MDCSSQNGQILFELLSLIIIFILFITFLTQFVQDSKEASYRHMFTQKIKEN